MADSDVMRPESKTPHMEQPNVRRFWAGQVLLIGYLTSPLLWQIVALGPQSLSDSLVLFNVTATVLWISLALSWTRRPLSFYVLAFPLFVTTAIDLFLLGTFGSRLSSGYIMIMLTDHGDAGEFFSAYAAQVAVVACVCIVTYVTGLAAVSAHRKRRATRLGLLILTALLCLYGATLARGLQRGIGLETTLLDLAGHEFSTPMGAVFQSALAARIEQVNGHLREQRAKFKCGAKRASKDKNSVFVWVVGESSRPANWSLFGYSRDTTPKLRASPGIVPLQDMLTTAPHTAVAVPSMLSLSPINHWSDVLANASIVECFNEVGFKTYWLSAQDADSWAGVIPQVAAEAKRRRYLDHGLDGALLPMLDEALADNPRGDLFIVLHTKGSHFEYARRYPAGFAQFGTPRGDYRQQLVDAYDNSVLYTDWFVDQIIGRLRERGGVSALFYASDHGENLLDDSRRLLGHAIGTRYDLQAAAFVWLSPELRTRHPDEARRLELNAAAQLSLSNLPHSMLDIAGIRTSHWNESMSVFSPKFEERSRQYLLRGQLLDERSGDTRPSQ